MVNYGDVERFYIPKPHCPINLGLWRCSNCEEEIENTEIDYDILIDYSEFFCKEIDKEGRVCGDSHLGYLWCDDCISRGNKKPHSHYGEYVCVGKIRSEAYYE